MCSRRLPKFLREELKTDSVVEEDAVVEVPIMQETRTCPVCTFENDIGALSCTMCSARMPKGNPTAAREREKLASAEAAARKRAREEADEELVAAVEGEVNALDCLYVADGHHRSAAASRVKKLRQEANPNHTGDEPYNYFLTVLFPHNQMQILDYNRLVASLNGHSVNEFLGALAENFNIELVEGQAKPSKAREFGFYAGKQWYLLSANSNLLETIDDTDPVASLDVSILQEFVFAPLLNIFDQRTDSNVDFVGGIRGLTELERRTAGDEWQAAFALYPTSIESLMDIADAGEVMPPKSTWFEPKLKSGLVIHSLK